MLRHCTACLWLALATLAGGQTQPATAPVGALRMAVINADADRLIELLDAGLDVDSRDQDNATPLHYAAAFNRRKLAELLLSRGAEIDARDAEDRTPLHLSAFGGCADTTLLLLERGADANAIDTGGFTPLHAAGGNREEGRRGTARIVRLLIERGDADVNAVSTETGATPLHVAASSNNAAVAAALLDAGAQIDATDDAGRTPLHVAAACGWREMVELLVGRKAAIIFRDGADRLPADLAEAQGHADIAKTLRDAAARGPL